MMSSIIILGKVALVCGAGFAVATLFEWMNDIEVKPKKKSISLGGEVESNGKVVTENERKINDLHKRVRSQN